MEKMLHINNEKNSQVQKSLQFMTLQFMTLQFMTWIKE